MRGPITRLCATAAAGLWLAACGPGPDRAATPANDAATRAATAQEAARADAMQRVRNLEAAVEGARQRVAAAAAAPALPRAQQIALSDTRRAIVVANVSLQKARTALASGDYAAAREATEGAADRLNAVVEGKPATSPQPPVGSRK